MRIFISYAFEDQDLAKQIAQALRIQGLDIFIAADDLLASEDYQTQIAGRISSWADAMICVLTNAYLNSGFAQTELRLAKRRWQSPLYRVMAFDADPDLNIANIDPYLKQSTISKPRPHDLPAEIFSEVSALRRKVRQRILGLLRNKLTWAALTIIMLAIAKQGWQLYELTRDRKPYYALREILKNRTDIRPNCEGNTFVLGDFVRKGSPTRKALRCPTQISLPGIHSAESEVLLDRNLSERELLMLSDSGLLEKPTGRQDLVRVKFLNQMEVIGAIAVRAAEPNDRSILMDSETRLVSELVYAQNQTGQRRQIGVQLSKLCWDASGRILRLDADNKGADAC